MSLQRFDHAAHALGAAGPVIDGLAREHQIGMTVSGGTAELGDDRPDVGRRPVSGEAMVGGDEDVGAQLAARELVEQSTELGVDSSQRFFRLRRADPALVGGGIRIGEPQDDDVRTEVIETDLEQGVDDPAVATRVGLGCRRRRAEPLDHARVKLGR